MTTVTEGEPGFWRSHVSACIAVTCVLPLETDNQAVNATSQGPGVDGHEAEVEGRCVDGVGHETRLLDESEYRS
jgi:hypothetical protein